MYSGGLALCRTHAQAEQVYQSRKTLKYGKSLQRHRRCALGWRRIAVCGRPFESSPCVSTSSSSPSNVLSEDAISKNWPLSLTGSEEQLAQWDMTTLQSLPPTLRKPRRPAQKQRPTP